MSKREKAVQCSKCFTLNPDDSQFCSRCGSSLENYQETLSYITPDGVPPEKVAPYTPGEIFDNRYRIIEEIGRGGMGRVYKAEDTELNITVALKIIRPRYSSDPHFVERFKKEMLTARSISHENVIRIFDLGETHKIKYISMEYIKGQNLRELIRVSGTLSLETVLNMAKQMCEALRVAHQKGIIHQDLKPSNIMVDNSGRVYILDFGLAKAAYGLESEKTGEIAGTPQFMSPEQAKGEKIDPRSDIYSLGAILYEMVTGKQVFEAASAEEYRQKNIAEIPVPPSKFNPRLPRHLDHIILKCLEKDKAKRYQSTQEMLVDLDRYILPKASLLTGLARRFGYFALAAMVLLAIAAALYLGKKSAAPPALKNKRLSLAIVYLTNNTGDKNLDYMRRNLSELLIADLLQSQYVRVMTGDQIYAILKGLNFLDAPTYSSEELKQLALQGSVDFILSGNFTEINETYRINTFLYKAKTMELLGSEQAEGQGKASIFSLIDVLTRKIKSDIKLPPERIAKDIDKDVSNITTSSPEALKHYIEGKKLYEEDKFEESVKALEKAVSLDPEFALAYVKMSEDYYYLLNSEQGDKFLIKALSLINRVSEREYYLIQGYAAFSYQSAVENYQKLLQLYPDDIEALGYLGAIYRNMEEWDLASEQFKKIVEIDATDSLSYENIALIYMAKGLYGKAIEILKSKQNITSDRLSFHIRMGTAYLCDRQYDLALQEASLARSVNSSDFQVAELEGQIYQIKGDMASAEKYYRQIMNSSDTNFQYNAQLWLGHLYLMQGKYNQTRKEIQQGLEHAQAKNFRPAVPNLKLLSAYVNLQMNQLPEAYDASNQALEAAQELNRIDYKNSSLHFRGLILAKMKKLEEARETAEKLKQQIEKTGVSKDLRLYHHLMGEIAREGGDITKAAESFETAISLLGGEYFKTDIHILFYDSLASAYYQKGDLERAQKAYEKVLSLTTGRLRWGDKYSKAFYWLARINQGQNRKNQAVEHYQKFLDLWNQTDPAMPEIADARKQLVALRASAQD
jgi:tetratricopeptide (TPR) repeat protein/predicted Ser/Thr protein kinase